MRIIRNRPLLSSHKFHGLCVTNPLLVGSPIDIREKKCLYFAERGAVRKKVILNPYTWGNALLHKFLWGGYHQQFSVIAANNKGLENWIWTQVRHVINGPVVVILVVGEFLLWNGQNVAKKNKASVRKRFPFCLS